MTEPHSPSPHARSGRKFIVSVGLLVYLIAYIVVAVNIGTMIADAPNWVQLIYYVVAGIAWIAPLKPVFGWMNTPPKGD